MAREHQPTVLVPSIGMGLEIRRITDRIRKKIRRMSKKGAVFREREPEERQKWIRQHEDRECQLHSESELEQRDRLEWECKRTAHEQEEHGQHVYREQVKCGPSKRRSVKNGRIWRAGLTKNDRSVKNRSANATNRIAKNGSINSAAADF